VGGGGGESVGGGGGISELGGGGGAVPIADGCVSQPMGCERFGSPVLKVGLGPDLLRQNVDGVFYRIWSFFVRIVPSMRRE
jgi:hypothetical protein